MRHLLILGLIIFLLSIVGCETPQGGSSLPWSRPEPWETQVLPEMDQ